MTNKLQKDTDGQIDSAQKKSSEIDPSEDGRSKEWQERSRVNLETVPEGTTTNIERDFEPEDLHEKKSGEDKNDEPAY